MQSVFARIPEVKTDLIYLSEPVEFDRDYIAVRSLEKRVYSDEIVTRLPILPREHKQYAEWQCRVDSTQRFLAWYEQQTFKHVLDIGCGNGWFTNQLERAQQHTTGLDINEEELRQAHRLFANNRLQFVYGDLFEPIFKPASFDLIVLNACAQYFSDFDALLNTLRGYLKPGGTIEIFDTRWYDADEVKAAAARTLEYYQGLGHPQMAQHYHHRSWAELRNVNHEVRYQPKSGLAARLSRLAGTHTSPFPWISIRP